MLAPGHIGARKNFSDGGFIMDNHQDHLNHNHAAMESLGMPIEALDILGFVSIFSSSLLMSLHCIGMCCPLVNSVLGKRAHITSRGIWLYNLGRLISYTGAGFLLGSLSASMDSGIPLAGQALSWIIGITLIIFAVLHPWRRHLRAASGRPFQFLAQALRNVQNFPKDMRDLMLGLITVALPCMTLSPALAFAAGTKSAWQATIMMLAFYLGTLPAMLSATSVPVLIGRRLPAWANRYGVAIFLLIAGIITLMRAFPHQH